MKQRVFFIIGFLCTATSYLFAQVPDSTLLYCDKPTISGLYRQCQEIHVIQDLGERARVYLNAERRVILVSKQNLFQGRRVLNHKELKAETKVAIPGDHLWNQNSEGFESICSVISTSTKTKMANVDCGVNKSGWIKFENLFLLKAYETGRI